MMTAIWRGREVQHDVGQTGDTGQTAGRIEIRQQGPGAGVAPVSGLGRIAQQGMDAGTRSVPGKTGKDAAGNVSAADNQYFLHAGIVAGAPSPGRRLRIIKGIA